MHNPELGGKFWLDRQIQPKSIVSSIKTDQNDYHKLRKEFLDDFAKPELQGTEP